MIETRNILLIGRTGNGKSALANVISGTSKFKESEFVNSETKDVQIEIVDIDGINYKIVDTVGLGDTELTMQQVLNKLADASHVLRKGLSQVLFVTSGRFTEEELIAFDLLRTVLFDENIVNYTTIVRTKFPGFRKPEKCEEDKKRMENDKRTEVVKLCNKFIHVNNLSEDEDPEQKAREDSRIILRTLLRTCQDVYKPKNLDEMNERIRGYMTEKEKMIKEMEELRNKGQLSEEELRKHQKKIESLEKEIASKVAQPVQEKNPGFFEKVGAWVGEGFTLAGEGIDKVLENLLIQPIKRCKIM
ncbi:P-loop containing nucleoside triphosphate hydrolase protein [Rhizophagus irregularis]|uniref:P-loop containing nucleoside triphosphate hydrolase protein n=3 Tax=Rhizophagus irregularis TaxID=588596 RepID=A0A2I1EAD3_9GLOM|nr:P-loop containing nucleoside triphosphate hydrolase protein [Rhizophagus irregularis DAOM 181602=DAOM 197198]PKC17605.1 P-loop containing nucleoside triphosphate hydrolase protein [Rhizophagus irregularis]PKC68333.1 P-loop containing nucleoside triphosphate hydrolase protein [Rhizophagus irregularis]PKY19095.1 P-loop containing nucleoside triphosphate hydrolase protein [Rhizophagus irregularis]POG75148.1 P-loop containing nucleoside triphosphate hydrolase protein [Rhizophagus irregularis DAO|eukprot:XP_025182014.1 P-loop containing nucleoside triphosphate hydrolase protein [Rhizophagus irregularis DAOM 181602=DAOM 197198]